LVFLVLVETLNLKVKFSKKFYTYAKKKSLKIKLKTKNMKHYLLFCILLFCIQLSAQSNCSYQNESLQQTKEKVNQLYNKLVKTCDNFDSFEASYDADDILRETIYCFDEYVTYYTKKYDCWNGYNSEVKNALSNLLDATNYLEEETKFIQNKKNIKYFAKDIKDNLLKDCYEKHKQEEDKKKTEDDCIKSKIEFEKAEQLLVEALVILQKETGDLNDAIKVYEKSIKIAEEAIEFYEEDNDIQNVVTAMKVVSNAGLSLLTLPCSKVAVPAKVGVRFLNAMALLLTVNDVKNNGIGFFNAATINDNISSIINGEVSLLSFLLDVEELNRYKDGNLQNIDDAKKGIARAKENIKKCKEELKRLKDIVINLETNANILRDMFHKKCYPNSRTPASGELIQFDDFIPYFENSYQENNNNTNPNSTKRKTSVDKKDANKTKTEEERLKDTIENSKKVDRNFIQAENLRNKAERDRLKQEEATNLGTGFAGYQQYQDVVNDLNQKAKEPLIGSSRINNRLQKFAEGGRRLRPKSKTINETIEAGKPLYEIDSLDLEGIPFWGTAPNEKVEIEPSPSNTIILHHLINDRFGLSQLVKKKLIKNPEYIDTERVLDTQYIKISREKLKEVFQQDSDSIVFDYAYLKEANIKAWKNKLNRKKNSKKLTEEEKQLAQYVYHTLGDGDFVIAYATYIEYINKETQEILPTIILNYNIFLQYGNYGAREVNLISEQYQLYITK